MSLMTLESALVGVDKEGPKYDAKKINLLASQSINMGGYFTKRGKHMSKDIDKSTELVDDAISRLNKSLNNMIEVETKIANSTKTVSTSVRQTTDKLAQGLARIEKQANFDKLERYVELLERANAAMSGLAELEASGKLDKIATAIR